MNARRAKPLQTFTLPIVALGSVSMAFAWLLTPYYGPWVANAAAAIPTLVVAFIWGEAARNLQLKPRALAWSMALGLTLAFMTWLLAPPLAKEFPALSNEMTRLYATLNRPPGPVRALPILLTTAATEELVWRGELVNWLQRRYGLVTTVIIATLSYSIPIAASRSILLFCIANGLGAILTLQRVATKSWIACSISHMIWALGVFVIRPIG